MQPWMLGLMARGKPPVRIDHFANQTTTTNTNVFNSSSHGIAAPEDNKVFVVCVFASGSGTISPTVRGTFRFNGSTVLNNVLLSTAEANGQYGRFTGIYYYDLSGVAVNEVTLSIAWGQTASRGGISLYAIYGVDSVAPNDSSVALDESSMITTSVSTLAGGVSIGAAHRAASTTGTLDSPFTDTLLDANTESAVRWLAGYEGNTPEDVARGYSASWGSRGAASIVVANWR